MKERTPKRVIFTDPGIDDSATLMYLNKHTASVQTDLVASFGNISEGQARINLHNLDDVFGFPDNWRILHGPIAPIQPDYDQYSKKAIYKGNGQDGLWMNSNIDDPRATTSEGEYLDIDTGSIWEMYSLAPLTGPILLQRAGAEPARTLIMGGAFLEGNVKALDAYGNSDEKLPRVAEWNIFKDAPAAREYFEKYAGLNVWVVTKDACMATLLSAKDIIAKESRPSVDYRFMKRLLDSWVKEYGKINPAVVQRGLILPDLVAAISYRNPDIVNWENTGIEVSTDIGPSLGRTFKSQANPKCNVATSVNKENIADLFEAINGTVFGE